MVFLKMKVNLQTLLASVGPTVYIAQFAMKLMWHGESEVYTNLNTSDLDGVIHSIEEDIKSSTERLTLYEKYAANNPDYIEEIILLKEYLEELTTSKNYCEFLRYIISWTSLGFSDFSQICCNVG